MTNKLCIDCKYFAPDTSWGSPDFQKKYARCARTAKVTPSDGVHCDSERNVPFLAFLHCGSKARYFEAQEPKQ